MLESYLRIALRNIVNRKTYAMINILGLAVGIAGCLILGLWVTGELSYDKFHRDADRIGMVLAHGSYLNNPSTPIVMAPVLEAEIPEIAQASRYETLGDALITSATTEQFKADIVTVDPAFFEIFSFDLLHGDPDSVLDVPNSIVVTSEMAVVHFGGENAVGRTLTMNHRHEMTITGVLADVPEKSSLRFDMVIPFEFRLRDLREQGLEPTWGWFSPNTYVKLHEGASIEETSEKITGFLHAHGDDEDVVLSLLPFTERYLFFSQSKTFMYIFSAVALFVLGMACINYVNLSTARSTDRAMEIGVRKVAGAVRGSLATQLLVESVVVTLLALGVAISIVELSLPAINAVSGLNLSFGAVRPVYAIPAAIGFAVVIGVAAGAYPAFYLSAFQPVRVLSGRLKTSGGHSTLRRILVVVQLAVAFFLIVGTLVVYRQLGFVTGTSLGYDKTAVISVALEQGAGQSYDELKAELLRAGEILSVTAQAQSMPHLFWSTGTAEWEGKDPETNTHVVFDYVDYDFCKTFAVELAEGRDYSIEFSSDATTGYVINEAMARLMGPTPAEGKALTLWDQPGTIVGVVEDFHFQSFTNRIRPLVLLLQPDRSKMNVMSVKLAPERVAEGLRIVREAWARILPHYPFEYTFLDDRVERMNSGIGRMARLSGGFAGIAMLIAGFGLYALASFIVERRSKEIAVRKVCGGLVSDLVLMLWREFALCILFAAIVATPLAYYCMQLWLREFAYRIDIGAGEFLIALFLVGATTLFAVSWRTIRAARLNPAVILH